MGVVQNEREVGLVRPNPRREQAYGTKFLTFGEHVNENVPLQTSPVANVSGRLYRALDDDSSGSKREEAVDAAVVIDQRRREQTPSHQTLGGDGGYLKIEQLTLASAVLGDDGFDHDHGGVLRRLHVPDRLDVNAETSDHLRHRFHGGQKLTSVTRTGQTGHQTVTD